MTTLVDTGPLVALLYRGDNAHEATAARASRIPHPLFTCEAVIAEACHLLRRAPSGADKLLALFGRGGLRSLSLADEMTAIRALMSKYKNVPMSFADACLVRLSEQHKATVWTLDSDFAVYRKNGRERIPLLK